MPVKPAPTSTISSGSGVGVNTIVAFPLNEGYGGTTAGVVASNTGTLSNASLWAADANGAYINNPHFGTNYVALGSAVSVSNGSPWSFAFAGKIAASGYNQQIFGTTSDASNRIYFSSNTTLNVAFGGSSVSFGSLDPTTQHMYLLVCDGSTIKLAVDSGAFTSTQAFTKGINLNEAGRSYGGASYLYWEGRIDWFQAWSRALSTTDRDSLNSDWTTQYNQPAIATSVAVSFADPYNVPIVGQTIRAPMQVKPNLGGTRYTGTITLTPSGGGLSSPTTFTYTNNVDQPYAMYIPTAAGTITWTTTNNQSLTNNNGSFSANADPSKPSSPLTIYPYRPRASNLLHDWGIAEGSGSTTADAVTIGPDTGTLSGANVTWTGTGQRGNVLSFTQTAASRVNLASTVSTPSSDWSLAWGGFQSASDSHGAILGLSTAASDYLRWHTGGFGVEGSFTSTTFSLNTAGNFTTYSNYVLIYTYSTGALKLYRDSILVGSATIAASKTLTFNCWGRAVNNNSAYDLTGQLDYIKLFNYALSAAEVLDEHNDPFKVNRVDSSVYQAGNLTVPGIAATRLDLAMPAASNGTSPYTYQLQESADGVTSWSNIGSPLTGQTGAATWTDSGLAPGTIRYYRTLVTDNASNVVYSNVASGTPTAITLTITNPVSSFAVQRVTDGGANLAAPVCGGSSGPLSTNGTYSGGVPLSLEYTRDGGSNWATLANQFGTGTISGGAWSRALTGVAQGQFDFQIRATNDTSVTATKTNIKIGEIFVGYGQSNMAGQIDTVQSYVATNGITASMWKSNAWAELADPTNNEGGARGSFIPHFCSRLSAMLGVPVSFINEGQSGQGLVNDDGSSQPSLRPPNGDGRGHNFWTNLTTAYANSKANAIRGVLFNHGESDSVSGMTDSAYLAGLNNLASYCASTLLGSPPLIVSQLGGAMTANSMPVFAAQAEFRTATSTGGGSIFMRNTELHPQSSGDPDPVVVYIADCMSLAVNEKFFNGVALSGRGPVYSSATFNAVKTQTTVVFDRPLKTGDTFTTGLWAVSDSGGVRAVSAVNYHGSNTSAVVITHAASTGTSPIISYGNLNDPVTAADASASSVSHNSGASVGKLGSGAGAVKGPAITLAAPTGFPSSVSLFAEPFVGQSIGSPPATSSININAGGGISGGITGCRRMSGIL